MPHYHSGCIGWLALALSTAKSNSEEFSPEFISKIKNGIDYSMYALRPSGTGVPGGDSDAEDAGPLHAALCGHRLFHNPDYLRIVVRCCGVEAVRALCIEGVWEHDDSPEMLAAIKEADATSGEISLPTNSWQKSLKQVMLRTDWSHDALSVFFACRTPINNAHAHIDPMGFDFSAYGRPLVVDPGRFTYREDAMLLVVDWVENLAPDDLIQLYFHLDSTRVDLDEKTGCAETRDVGMANMLIVPSPDFSGALLPGRISDALDFTRPSTRLCLTAARSRETNRAFATVVAPWPVSSPRPSVSAPRIVRKSGGTCCEFQTNGRAHSFELPQA